MIYQHFKEQCFRYWFLIILFLAALPVLYNLEHASQARRFSVGVSTGQRTQTHGQPSMADRLQLRRHFEWLDWTCPCRHRGVD